MYETKKKKKEKMSNKSEIKLTKKKLGTYSIKNSKV
jgi:hypothetical protein